MIACGVTWEALHASSVSRNATGHFLVLHADRIASRNDSLRRTCARRPTSTCFGGGGGSMVRDTSFVLRFASFAPLGSPSPSVVSSADGVTPSGGTGSTVESSWSAVWPGSVVPSMPPSVLSHSTSSSTIYSKSIEVLGSGTLSCFVPTSSRSCIALTCL